MNSEVVSSNKEEGDKRMINTEIASQQPRCKHIVPYGHIGIKLVCAAEQRGIDPFSLSTPHTRQRGIDPFSLSTPHTRQWGIDPKSQ